jgi:hypothetical protein
MPKAKQVPALAASDLIFIDRETLANRCCMSLGSFETYLQQDPQLKLIQRRFPTDGESNKRNIFYPADKAKEVCLRIMEGWPQ